MKILLINNFHYRKGGSEAVYFNTAELLKAHGHDVVFFSYNDANNIECDCQRYFINRHGGVRGVADYFYNRSAAMKLEELVKNEKPDIAHIHLFWGGISPSIFKVLKNHGVPVVHTCHDYRLVCPGYTFKDGRGEGCERCNRWNYYQCALHRCAKGNMIRSIIMSTEMYTRQLFFNPLKNLDGLIFVSRFSEQKHIQHHPGYKDKKHTVIYNYTAPCLEPYFSPQKDYILYYGRLSHEKGISTLLNVASRHPEWKLKVVGTGPLENELRTQYERHTNIEFPGYHTGDALFDFVRNARFVCVPSEWYENNPMTIIESYSLGTPVIGADIGGIPEIIEDGRNGFLFKAGDACSLEKILEQSFTLTDENYLELCYEAYDFYRKNFAAEGHYQKLIDFYNDCSHRNW